MDFLELAVKIGMYFLPFLFALCFHEYAHGFVAKLRGDNTAETMGRLSMNPIVHMDMLGTFILPILAIVLNSPIFFGWAKPVPVNPRNLKKPRQDMFWVALAGPVANVLLAIIGAFLIAVSIRVVQSQSTIKAIFSLLDSFIVINLFLAVFNLIPLNPLDGGKIIARFLPAHINYKLEQNEQMTSFVLLILILSGALKILSIPVLAARLYLLSMATNGMYGGLG